jgi:hypothetical protein
VYDFTDPRCRKSEEIPPEKFPLMFDPNLHDYGDYLKSNPLWKDAVEGNLSALKKCNLCILLLPCGADSHSDWGVAVGMGKRTIVVGHPASGERTPSHLWAESILPDEVALIDYLHP